MRRSVRSRTSPRVGRSDAGPGEPKADQRFVVRNGYAWRLAAARRATFLPISLARMEIFGSQRAAFPKGIRSIVRSGPAAKRE